MTIQEINKAYNRITVSLDNKELKNAFDYSQSLIAGTREYSFQDKLNELHDTYKYMLRYRLAGMKDPMQEQIYHNLLSACYELADSVKHKALAIDSPLSFYSHRRTLSKENSNYAALHYALKKTISEKELTLLFEKIWTSDFLSEEEALALKKMLVDRELPYLVTCQIVSALLLGSLSFFDPKKLSLLFDAADIENDEVRYRALICILLVFYTYRKRIFLYPRILDRLAALSETFPNLTKAVRTITLRFILSRETEKISWKLQDEIIQEMIKLSPKLSKEINPELMGGEMNPEWQELLANSSLGKKMEEFSELQQEGADVMHSTFVHLKHFPFFRELGNWFLPFTAEYLAVLNPSSRNHVEKEMLKSMKAAAFMCDSDKYSLYFSMMQLPEQARQMMVGQFGDQAAEMIQQNNEELISKRGKLEIISGQYIQDLYRFFKLYPRHLDFDDIFKSPLDFHNLPFLRPYIHDEESLTTIAEYYLRKNYFTDALSVYQRLSEHNKESDILYQKIGYCKQMSGNIQGALEAYLNADIINPNSKWLIRKIAGCYRTLKQPEKALRYYRRCESANPEDLSIQLAIGLCFLEQKDYNEALKYYFKVDYLDSKSMKAWRPIAWCSFLTGKYDQARKYYKKILGNQPNTQDYLNAGHTEWTLQNIKGALSFYEKAVKNESDDFQKFQKLFERDIPDLLLAGIEEAEIPLMLDQLRYTLSGTL